MTVGADPSARIQVRGVATLQHPGCCAVCGSGDAERLYVDPGVFVDFEGQFYFCNICTEEMGSTIGMLTSAEAQFLIQQNNKYEVRNTELEKVREAYDRLVVALRDAAISAASPSGSLLADSSDIISEAEPEGYSGDPLSNDEPTVSGEKELTKSIKSTAERGQLTDASQSATGDGFNL